MVDSPEQEYVPGSGEPPDRPAAIDPDLRWVVMYTLRRLKRLLRHPGFRRLVIVRTFSQGGDAVVQVGMATYLLFSPQSQPNAWAVAAVIALVMLPFSVVGPFVSPILDRHDRRRVVVISDLTRMTLAAGMTVLVVTGRTGASWQALLMVLLLVALSLNRLQIAGLSAGMPLTVDDDEYLDAAALMPVLGPMSGIIGGAFAGLARLASGRLLATQWADGLVFLLASLLFTAAAGTALGFKRGQLGPAGGTTASTWAKVFAELADAVREIRRQVPAAVSMIMVFFARLGYGALMTAIIVLYRHYFGSDADLESVMVQMGSWFLVSGAGFALSGAVATPASGRIGVRRTLIAAFAVAAVVQLVPGSLLTRPSLLVSGFVLGLCLQSVKICADTVVQAHIVDELRGRVMVIYDIINNLGYVVGAVIAAALLPFDGHRVPFFVGLAILFAVCAAVFALVSSDKDDYQKGTVRRA